VIIVVEIGQGGVSRRDAVTARRSERFSRGGAFDGADVPSSVIPAPSGGHDRRLAAG
jgi:hypothetical protein